MHSTITANGANGCSANGHRPSKLDIGPGQHFAHALVVGQQLLAQRRRIALAAGLEARAFQDLAVGLGLQHGCWRLRPS